MSTFDTIIHIVVILPLALIGLWLAGVLIWVVVKEIFDIPDHPFAGTRLSMAFDRWCSDRTARRSREPRPLWDQTARGVWTREKYGEKEKG